MSPGPPRRRRARPVADAPIEALLGRSEDLAKGWLFALLEQAPLDEAPRILAADLAREGPRVCDALLRALVDDVDLRRLEPGGALAPLAARVGELAGAAGPAAASTAVDALQGVVWAALRSELRDPDPELVTELAERLARVSELMRLAALSPRAQTRPGPAPAPEPGSPTAPPAAPAAAPEPGSPTAPPPAPAAAFQAAPLDPRGDWPPGSAPVEAAAEALWVKALHEEIRRASDTSLALLLAELEDADRVLVVEGEEEAARTLGAFARAVRSVARRQDILVSETESRAWIIAPDTGRTGAQALASRIADAVRDSPGWRSAPLAASVGVAVLGEDGEDGAELIEAAEGARYAAAARGLDVLRAVPDADPPEV